ncbi:MAG TPA: hypothetical protein EYP57_06520, partial [Thermodesulfobacteriaceae bacterium]|nr:hypothetical protein [Thermodesulfobacteriaceae bacterium]
EFRRVGTAELADHLDRIVMAEKLDLPRDATMMLAREAGGSVRDSLSLLDQVSAYGARSQEDICEAIGIVGTRILKEMAFALLESDLAHALTLLDTIYRFGGDVEKFIADLMLFFRHLLLLKTVNRDTAASLVNLADDEMEELASDLSGHSSKRLLQVLNLLLKAQDTIHRTSTPRLSLEIILIQLCNLKEIVGIDALIERADRLLAGLKVHDDLIAPGYSERKRTKPRQPPAQVAESPLPDRQPVRKKTRPGSETSLPASQAEEPPQSGKITTENWSRFRYFVKKHQPPLGSLMDCCEDIEADPQKNRICLLCRPGVHQEMLHDKAEQLKEAAALFFGRSVDIVVRNVSPPEDSRSENNNSRTCNRRSELVQLPLVQEALKVFQARISDVKIPDSRGKSTF